MVKVQSLERNYWIHSLLLTIISSIVIHQFKEIYPVSALFLLSFYYLLQLSFVVLCFSAFEKLDFDRFLPEIIARDWKYLALILWIFYSILFFQMAKFYGVITIMSILIFIQASSFTVLTLFINLIPVSYWPDADPVRFWFNNLKFATLVNSLIWAFSIEGLKHFVQSLKRDEIHARPASYAINIKFNAPLSLDELPSSILKEIDILDANLGDEWIVNPSLFIGDRYEKSPISDRIIKTQTHSALYQIGTHFIIEDPGFKIIYQYNVDKYKTILMSLKPGENIPKDVYLGENDIKLFKFANVIVRNNYWKERMKFHDKFVFESQKMWKNHNYVVLPSNIFNPLHLYFFEDYCDRFLKSLEGTQNTKEYLFSWDNQIAVHYNLKLVEIVSEITNEDLTITRPLILFYQKKSNLPLHVDYHPFLYSCSMSLKKNNIPQKFSFISSNFNEMIDIDLERGEMILFKGQQCPHYRKSVDSPIISVSFSFNFFNPIKY